MPYFMEALKKLTPLFHVTIAFCAVFTALGLMFNILLGPIEARMDSIEVRMDRMEARMDSIEARMGQIDKKLDQLLSFDREKRQARRKSAAL